MNKHIEVVKSRKLVSSHEYRLYYDKIDENKIPILIEVNKIQGIDTGWETEEKSIYDLFFSVTGELSMRAGLLHAGRTQENIDSLIKNGIQYQHNFYKTQILKHF
ncbi:hypothetical protein [Bacillus sp. SD088]|uniref:hypothetical protein n=1 Tax=Bacillus sp. SD088 TaxID=2782012 RepID=UPI001A971193|nr:hypothetical protein [Bacillus sp. SD088]MBO0994145.1 hypothetical protein [Bacillus sp. SD088]